MKNQVNLYPNPTKGDIILDCSKGIKSIKIFDYQGNLLEKAKGSFHLNLSHLKPGIYGIEVTLKTGETELTNVIVE